MKAVLAHIEKILALAVCVGLAAGLSYFFLGRNLALTLGISSIIGIISWFEINKSKPGHISGEFSLELLSELIFRGIFALIFLAISAISS